MTLAESDRARWLAALLGTDFLLWSPHQQAPGFLHWNRIFATRRIHAGDPRPLPRATEELSVEYEFLGTRRDVADLMRDEHLSGLLVLRDGVIQLERYGLGLQPHLTWQSSSMVKSLTSTLIGAAIHDGLIQGLDDLVTSHLPELEGTAYEQVTLRHLLQMCSGTVFSEEYENLRSDVVEKYLRPIAERRPGAILTELKGLARAHPPGTQFAYNTGDTYLLSHIISRAAGTTVADYCAARVWTPAGMEVDGFFMLDADDGQEITGSCCGASLRDYARLGQLMLDDGVAANGERVLPEGWVAEATAPSSPNFEFALWDAPEPGFLGYGYLWWVLRPNTFTALGVYGQWIHVDPSVRSVVVMIGAMPREVYMSPEEPAAQVGGSQHGSPARLAFIDAVNAQFAAGGR
jgi:CubicO group peptidase (beta-lactamase class C family)